MTSMPPLAPVIPEFTKASAATFIPTCFIETMERFPQNDIPRASSTAVFSLDDQWEWIPRSFVSGWLCTNSRISVDGVPG